jgi:acyl-CoA thioesterase I
MFLRACGRRHWIAALLAACAFPGIAATAAAAPAQPPVVLVVGDSLSAEYGLKRGTGWVPLLQQRIAGRKRAARVVNASISGDTTSGGRSRLAPLLAQHRPAVVILELGSNDALRGLPLDMTRANLDAMTGAAQQAGAKVLLVGMEMPPNYGADYANRFVAIYREVASARHAALVPFLLKGIADDPDPLRLFQADRLHPNEQAQARMLDNVWPELSRLLPGGKR